MDPGALPSSEQVLQIRRCNLYHCWNLIIRLIEEINFLRLRIRKLEVRVNDLSQKSNAGDLSGLSCEEYSI